MQRGAVDWVDAAAVQTALGADGAARADRLAESGLLVSLPGGSGRVKIAPDPLAEHLAALRFASDLRNDLTAWASHLDGLVERAVKAETGAQLLGLLDALDRVARSDPDEVLTPETRAGMHRLIGAARSKLTPAAPP